MSSNKTDKNIANAFKVVYATYENIEKLMLYLFNSAKEKGDYTPRIEKFLRWSGDSNYHAWAYHSIILVFQKTSDPELENGWRDGPLYIIDFNLYDFDEALVQTARFDYYDMSALPENLSPGDHWRFDGITTHHYYDLIEYTEEDDGYYYGDIKDLNKADKSYWGLRRVTGYSYPLTEITSENAYDMVFGNFNLLAQDKKIKNNTLL